MTVPEDIPVLATLLTDVIVHSRSRLAVAKYITPRAGILWMSAHGTIPGNGTNNIFRISDEKPRPLTGIGVWRLSLLKKPSGLGIGLAMKTAADEFQLSNRPLLSSNTDAGHMF
ncbi:MAG: hypothetical protein WCK95_28725 [Alphaproteobacteria bacterium]